MRDVNSLQDLIKWEIYLKAFGKVRNTTEPMSFNPAQENVWFACDQIEDINEVLLNSMLDLVAPIKQDEG